ncbi:MAG: ribbon-helix-helix protein, CopG family [Ruminococcaceae bacterium]|nr:ribbon-helix-helix protein, CopG family [Oscillospiraceae bacterium]
MANKIIKINKKGEDGYKVISIRIPDGTLKKLDDLSQKSNRSRNEIINIILDSSIDDVEIN